MLRQPQPRGAIALAPILATQSQPHGRSQRMAVAATNPSHSWTRGCPQCRPRCHCQCWSRNKKKLIWETCRNSRSHVALPWPHGSWLQGHSWHWSWPHSCPRCWVVPLAWPCSDRNPNRAVLQPGRTGPGQPGPAVQTRPSPACSRARSQERIFLGFLLSKMCFFTGVCLTPSSGPTGSQSPNLGS